MYQLGFLIFLAALPPLVGYAYTSARRGHWYGRVNFAEVGICLIVGVLVAVSGYFVARDSLFSDLEFLNGSIVGKDMRRVSCAHCRTVCDSRDKDGNCTASHTECDHDYDQQWFAWTDYQPYFPSEGTIIFPNVDAQGLGTPPGWAAVQIGQPATTLHRYENIARGAGQSSVFGYNPKSSLSVSATKQGLVPRRPQAIYEGWSLTPKFQYKGELADGRPSGNGFSTLDLFNVGLMSVNAEAGPKVQADVEVLVCANNFCDALWATAVMDAWRGGAKNGVNVFIGADSDNKPTWVEVKYGLPGENQSEAERKGNNAYLAVILRDRILSEVADATDPVQMLPILREEVLENFNRKPNADFKYLKPGVHPTTGQMWFMSILILVVTSGLTVYFEQSDPFNLD